MLILFCTFFIILAFLSQQTGANGTDNRKDAKVFTLNVF